MSDRPQTFFLDTNVVVDNPDSLYELGRDPRSKVVLTDIVVGELDVLKQKDFASVNARRVSAKLMRLSGQEHDDHEGVIEKGDLMRGVHLGIRIRDAAGEHYERGGKLMLYSAPRGRQPELRFAPNLGQSDLALIRACLAYAGKHKSEDVILVTGDKNLVTTARANGLRAEHRENENLSTDNLYNGYGIVRDDALLGKLLGTATKYQRDRHFPVSQIDAAWAQVLVGNQYLVFVDDATSLAIEDGKRMGTERMFRYDPVARELRGISYTFQHPMEGVRPQNMEQTLALDALLSDEIRLNVLLGIAGGGKTYLALAVALYKTLENRRSNPEAKIYLTKRDVTIGGEDYGFLPGELESKVINQYHAIAMNWQKLVMLMGRRSMTLGLTLREAMSGQNPIIEIIPFGFLRGVTFGPRDILIVEEIQNIEPRGMKPILTRVGGGEVYCTGDIYQPDNVHVRVDYNGANYTIDRIVKTREPRMQCLLSAITMTHCERSEFAEWAARHL